MLEPTHVESLVKAHAYGDDDRSCGVDDARARLDLPKFSGKPTACRKCEYCPAPERFFTDRYVREGGAEFLERTCRNCGYVWYEQCADAGRLR